MAGPESQHAFRCVATIHRRPPVRRPATRRAQCARAGRSSPAGSCSAPERCRRAQARCRRPTLPSGCRTALQIRWRALLPMMWRRPAGLTVVAADGSFGGFARRTPGRGGRRRRVGRRCRRRGCGQRWRRRCGSRDRCRRLRLLRTGEFERPQPPLDAAYGADLRECYDERRNGHCRNRQRGKHQHEEKLVHPSPHAPIRERESMGRAAPAKDRNDYSPARLCPLSTKSLPNRSR